MHPQKAFLRIDGGGGDGGGGSEEAAEEAMGELRVSGIGPIADKTAWPELVGKPAAEARAIVEAEGAGIVKQVQCIPADSMVTMDMREDRVRIFTASDGTVARAPIVG
jgi:hypothetical protein